jgi:hypothetical protein
MKTKTKRQAAKTKQLPAATRQRTAAPEKRAKDAAPRRRRKTFDVDQQLLDDARLALGCDTETETVRRALESVVTRERQLDAVRRMAGRKWFDRSKIED